MAVTQVIPTRMELTRLKKKLVIATRGHKLLKDKRDELMRQFMEMVRENMELRRKVEAGIAQANRNFVVAKASMDAVTLNTALMAPKQEIIYPYGLAFTSGELDLAVKSLADIFPDMLKLAEIEKSCRLMAREIEKTRRRVNALEHVTIPDAKRGIRYITMKLDENERGAQVRLMKVKDRMLEEAHHYSER